MTWDAGLTVYHARLVAAGQLVTPKITSVARGEPKALQKKAHVAYWWGGRRESETGGNTLKKVNVEEGVVTTIYVPESIRLPAQMSGIEDYLRAVLDAIHGQLWGGFTFGGNAIGLDISTTEAGWVEVSGIVARTANFTSWIDLAEVHSIAE